MELPDMPYTNCRTGQQKVCTHPHCQNMERRDLREALGRVIAEKRIRHDHAYPMEVGPHHCDGCDLEADIRALAVRTPAAEEEE